MVRLTRVQQQERTRAEVLAAARDEFAEHGYGLAKVDRIAERAELTRGAVYSNFPSKRALYLAVLTELVESAVAEPQAERVSLAEALGLFARVWLERLPLAGDSAAGGRLQLRSLEGVLDDHGRVVLAEVARLEALLLGLALEDGRERRVRLAALVLTLLEGAGHQAESAPGAGDPFDVAKACGFLGGIDLADEWAPPHLAFVKQARVCADGWEAPAGLVDRIRGAEVDLGGDGVTVVLGARRLGAAEEAVRAAGVAERVTVVVTASDPAETGRLVRLRVADLMGGLGRVFVAEALPALELVLDDEGRVARALGLQAVGDETEAAVRVRDGKIVARAEGRGAGHAVATARKAAGR